MRALLAALALLVLFSNHSESATMPASPSPATVQPLPAKPEITQIPELDPGLEGIFGPIEKLVGTPIVITAGPPKVEPAKPERGPCADQKPGNCVLAYRFEGSVDDSTMKQFKAFMGMARAARAQKVMIELTTPGGVISSGHEISRAIEMFPGATVCVADAQVASMGMYILQSCDRRVMTKRAVLMLHPTSILQTKGSSLNAGELRAQARQSEVFNNAYIAHVIAKTKLTEEEYRKHAGRGAWYMNHGEAFKWGLVDMVIDVPPNKLLRSMREGLDF